MFQNLWIRYSLRVAKQIQLFKAACSKEGVEEAVYIIDMLPLLHVYFFDNIPTLILKKIMFSSSNAHHHRLKIKTKLRLHLSSLHWKYCILILDPICFIDVFNLFDVRYFIALLYTNFQSNLNKKRNHLLASLKLETK